MNKHLLDNAKAYAALIGSVLTAVLATSTDAPQWLAIVAAVCTAIATWAVPNVTKPTASLPQDEAGAADVGLGLLVAILLGVVLLLFGIRF